MSELAVSVNTTAAEVLWSSCETHPDRPCVTDLDRDDAGGVLSYAELTTSVAALAGGLLSMGLEPGDRVGLLLHNSCEYIEAFLAAIASGLVVVPLNVRLLGEDYRHMLSDSGARVLVTTEEFLDRVPDLPGLTVIRADLSGPGSLSALAGEGAPLSDPVSRQGTDVASLMYTSGTTGLPKAVMLTHDSWRSVAETCLRVLDFASDEVILHVAPLTHGAGFLFLPTLMSGGHNVLCRSFDPARTVEILRNHDITGMFVVPSMIRMLLDAAPAGYRPPASFRRLYYAGSPIDPATLREAAEVFGGRVVQSFAQMESPMFFTVLDQDDHRRILAESELRRVHSAGRVLPDVILRVVDDEGQAVPTGEVGEILARAPQTMAGYWNRPEETAKTLADGWLHTGDVGYVDDDNYLYIVDRKKDMIVTGGSNVYAREVEEVLLGVDGVRDATVIGLPHRVWGEAVTAVLVPTAEPLDEQAVIKECRAVLAGYRVPKRVLWMEELPRNAYGKILKRQLRDQLQGGE
jgi:acyl-CoA synthetase (AMP-forming)/AMP-acid ligase II